MIRSFCCRLLALLLLSGFGSCLAPEAVAQTSVSASHPAVTADTLNARIEETEAAEGLDAATKTKLTEIYRQALSNLEAEAANGAAADAYLSDREAAPVEAERIRGELEKDRAESAVPTPGDLAEVATAEIEQRLLSAKTGLAALDARITEIENQLADEAGRPELARERLTKLKQNLEALDEQRQAPPPADELPAMGEARTWLLQTERSVLDSEIQRLDQELLSQPMRVELLEAQREQSAREAERLRERVGSLGEIVNQRRMSEAESAQAQAQAIRQEAIGKHSVVQGLAEENAELSNELADMAARLEEATAAQNQATAFAQRIAEDFANTRKKLEIAGLNQALGEVMQEQRRRLPDLRVLRKQADEGSQAIAEAGLRQLRYKEERRRLRDIPGYTQSITQQLSPEERAAVGEEVGALLEGRQEILDQASETGEAYLRGLAELDFEQRRLIETIEAFGDFLAERLLWVRSASPVSLGALHALPAEAARLLSPASWFEVLRTLTYQATHSPILLLAVMLIGTLIWHTRKLRRALLATAEKIGKPTTDRIRFSFRALGLTLLLAVPGPLLLAALGLELRFSLEGGEFTKSVGKALLWVSPNFFFLQALRQLCLPQGLAAAHFRWPQDSLRMLRREIYRLMLVFVPVSFLTGIVIRQDTASQGGTLGLSCFIAVMGSLALFFYRTLHPGHGVLERYLRRHKESLLARSSRLWFALAVSGPAAFVALALAGYLYTAGTLTTNLINTAWMILGLVVVQNFALRWLFIIQRRLAYKEGLEQRAEQRRAAREQESRDEDALFEIEQPKAALGSLNEESRKLLKTALISAGLIGLWLIWSDVLPAFGILDEITLWHHTVVVDGIDKRLPITLEDMVLAVLIAGVAIVAARSLPDFLELVILRRFQLSPSASYTFTTLTSYVVATLGFLLVFNTIGLSWSQVQWLVAALGVGIGFGLQEIVANFISGLIILFERPIRVGDMVTVGETDGVVTRIRIRATTIRNLDRKELLVPNKEFITGRLLNWSLSDRVVRIAIPVGVAYGSDVDRALALMNEAAEEHANVLRDPEPRVTFEGFGDNALMLFLRCHLESLDARLATISELHLAINRKFNQAGLVISFPQRDVHLDTNRPLDIRIRRASGGSDGADPSPAAD